jgi:hypothetical protein
MNLANKWPSLPLLLLLGGRGNMEDPKERYTKTTELFSSKIRTVKNMHFKNFSQGKFSTAGLSLSLAESVFCIFRSFGGASLLVDFGGEELGKPRLNVPRWPLKVYTLLKDKGWWNRYRPYRLFYFSLHFCVMTRRRRRARGIFVKISCSFLVLYSFACLIQQIL